jgi:kinesin family protein C1
VSQLVTSILDGYRVCMFAYGQTGSGKTYTMEGPPGCGDGSADRGLIPRAVSKLFEEAAERETRGWKTSVQVSFLEIYNEGLRDLLDNRPGLEKKMEIMTDPATGMTYVTNLITMEVLDCKVVESLLRRASKARATAATECNERSSRSHSIFTMKVVCHVLHSLSRESRSCIAR